MPNDLKLTSVGAAPIGAAPATDPPVRPAARPPSAEPPTAASGFPSPSLYLDPALGLVVIEFHNAEGDVKSSIPSRQQLEAYRTWDRNHAGPAPNGGGAPQPAKASEAPRPTADAPAPAAKATERP